MGNQEIQQELAKIEKEIAALEVLRGTLPDERIEATLTHLRRKKAQLTGRLPTGQGTTYEAKVKGGGAVAQGPGATAVGSRGVQVGGSAGGSVVTGDSNRLTQVGGDQVGGDKITTGDISGSTVAMGREAQVRQGISGEELAAIFQTVYQKIEARPQDPDVDQEEIVAQVQQIEAETAVPGQPNESKLARMAPDIVDVMAASLAGPVAGAAAVLRKIIARVKSENEG